MGWSTYMPSYKPTDIIRYLQGKLKNKKMAKLQPWYRDFKGKIHALLNQQFISVGNIAVTKDDEVEITELPITYSIVGYKKKVINLSN